MDKNKKQISDDNMENVSGGVVEIKLTGEDAEQYMRDQALKVKNSSFNSDIGLYGSSGYYGSGGSFSSSGYYGY